MANPLCVECHSKNSLFKRTKACELCRKMLCPNCRTDDFAVIMCLPCSKIWQSAFPPKRTRDKPLVVLDLDETIVHTSFQPIPHDFTVDVKGETLYVAVRPGTAYFIEQISSVADILLWTASVKTSACPVIDKIDSKGLLYGRLYKDACVQYESGQKFKDISKLLRPMERIVIVDDNPMSYDKFRDNGISLTSWTGDMNDTELTNLVPRLRDLLADTRGSILLGLSNIREEFVEIRKVRGIEPVPNLWNPSLRVSIAALSLSVDNDQNDYVILTDQKMN